MADSTPKIYVGNATLFIFRVVDQDDAVVDLSGLSGSSLEMIFIKPDGVGGETRTVVNGTLSTDGTDGRYEYQAASVTFVDTAGKWKRQGHITLSGGEQYWTDAVVFTVHPTL